MPFGVRKWADSLDPRNTLFCWKGWADGAMPPYLYGLIDLTAYGPLSIFTSMVVLPVLSFGEDNYEAGNVDIAGSGASAFYTIYGYNTLQTSPVDHTVHMLLDIVAPGTNIHHCDIYLDRPPAINALPFNAMTVLGGGTNYLPGGITINPMPWNTPTT